MCVGNIKKQRILNRDKPVWKVVLENKDKSSIKAPYNSFYYMKYPHVNIAEENKIDDDDGKPFITGFCSFTREEDAVLFADDFNYFHEWKLHGLGMTAVVIKALVPNGATARNAMESFLVVETHNRVKIPCIISDKLIIK